MGETYTFSKRRGISEYEFIALMAFLMANVALSIDAILPGLPDIGTSFNIHLDASLQLIVTLIFLGLACGELVFGTLSDSFGRKPIVLVGVGIFIIASIICVIAPNLEVMLLGRVLQGIGLSAPRTVSMAIIRDSYSGDNMARIMSFISAIFVLVPMVAPILGQVILDSFNWHYIFYFQLLFVLVTIAWFWFRQEETLTKTLRIEFTSKLFINGLTEFLKIKTTVIYTLIAGLMEGVFILYLSISQQVFQKQYGLHEEFPYIFAGLSLTFGIATFLNGKLVVKYGMKKLVAWSLNLFLICSLIYILLFYNTENPDIEIVLFFLIIQFLLLGFIFGNLSALAMQPIGHIAGVGAAIFSFVSMIFGVIISLGIGGFVTTTVLPLFISFFVTGFLAIILIISFKTKELNV